METQSEPRLVITAAEAAQLLGCSVQTVKRLASAATSSPSASRRAATGCGYNNRLTEDSEAVGTSRDGGWAPAV